MNYKSTTNHGKQILKYYYYIKFIIIIVNIKIFLNLINYKSTTNREKTNIKI